MTKKECIFETNCRDCYRLLDCRKDKRQFIYNLIEEKFNIKNKNYQRHKHHDLLSYILKIHRAKPCKNHGIYFCECYFNKHNDEILEYLYDMPDLKQIK